MKCGFLLWTSNFNRSLQQMRKWNHHAPGGSEHGCRPRSTVVDLFLCFIPLAVWEQEPPSRFGTNSSKKSWYSNKVSNGHNHSYHRPNIEAKAMSRHSCCGVATPILSPGDNEAQEVNKPTSQKQCLLQIQHLPEWVLSACSCTLPPNSENRTVLSKHLVLFVLFYDLLLIDRCLCVT